MFEENRSQELNEGSSISRWVIIAGVLLVLATLGGLIYSFLTPVP